MNIPHPDNPRHTENLSSIELLEAQGFEGPDASLDISLFEYGIAWRVMEKETIFIYGIKWSDSKQSYTRFDRCSYSNDTDPYKEWNWIKDWSVFWEPLEITKEEWDKWPFEKKVYEIFTYYGYENIFGPSYWEGFEIKE